MLLTHGGCLVDVNYQRVLPLGKYFDTSKVIDMGGIFTGCKLSEGSSLGKHFGISNVTGMRDIFHWCIYDVINIDDN